MTESKRSKLLFATDMLQYMGWTKIECVLFNQVHFLDLIWKDARNLTPANAWLYDSLFFSCMNQFWIKQIRMSTLIHPNKNLHHYFLCVMCLLMNYLLVSQKSSCHFSLCSKRPILHETRNAKVITGSVLIAVWPHVSRLFSTVQSVWKLSELLWGLRCFTLSLWGGPDLHDLSSGTVHLIHILLNGTVMYCRSPQKCKHISHRFEHSNTALWPTDLLGFNLPSQFCIGENMSTWFFCLLRIY